MVHFHPHLATEMLAYQEAFCNLNKSYPFRACSQYDIAVRMKMARNKSASWALTDDYAFNRFLRCAPPAASQVTCYRCRVPGHLANACPNQANTNENRFFRTNLPCSVAATSTTTTAAPIQLAHFPTNASNAEEHTLCQTVSKLKTIFKPLLSTAFTPVNVTELKKELAVYHDKLFADNLSNCFVKGFKIGFSGPEFSNIVHNLKSADSFESVITDAITNELKENRVAGPFASPPLTNFRTSPIGVVPKKEPNKFRMIMDLSSPKGQSVNDSIADEEASVKFNSFDDAVKLVAELGQGALLAKLDIKSAFRICPVHPEDWHLLGFTFCGLYFVDLCLPFGLRSSVNRFLP